MINPKSDGRRHQKAHNTHAHAQCGWWPASIQSHQVLSASYYWDFSKVGHVNVCACSWRFDGRASLEDLSDFKSFPMCTMGRYRCPRTCVGVWAATAIATASAAAAAVVTPWPEPVADEKWAGTLSMMRSGLAKVVPLNLTLH